MEGVGSNTDNVLVLAATNRPFDLDSAALRRLPVKVLIGLPDEPARKAMIKRNLKDINTDLEKSKSQMNELVRLTENYSASDLKTLIKEAAMMPLKELPPEELLNIQKEDLRKVTIDDFKTVFEKFIPSYSGSESMAEFEEWG